MSVPAAADAGLPVTRIHALSAHPGAPIFRLQGGPGITNMDFPAASRFAARHDVVLFGFRGVDGSSKLDCPEVASARAHARDFLTDSAYGADAAAFAACAHRLQRSGVDLAGYSLPERVDDFETARRALGYGPIDLVSESAGTRTAQIYAWRYPSSIHRSVMIAVNPPGDFLWDARTTGEQIRKYARLCAAAASCRARTPDLAASIHSALTDTPKRWWFLPVRRGDFRTAVFFGLMNATADGGGPIPGPKTIDTLLSVDRGDAGGAWFLSLLGQVAFPHAQVWGDAASVGRIDAAAARRYFAEYRDRGSVIGAPGTDMIWAGGRLLDAWPANPDENEYATVRDSKVETLLVGGALDFATPPQNATRQLLPHLPNGRQVLGLGGWFAGALVVLVAFPTTPLDDQALAALSIGLPVGLGIYLASARRGRSLGTKVAGLAAALAGAVVGGWLGFHTMDGLFALVPTVIGAAAGANLAVLALDVARDLRARDRSDVRTRETLDASPSLG